ncbi:bifunctional UDP-N-acetylglucosamine diphosphorylase/glucosamine-1-phosphate N-acetyltransferase GlmU [Beggiatoa leptomitoformis]|uniref:Bifunctional protein GlmU n=1 Tax=Beggiatoa leptomitoformis TaxID=288004 RepID=A0A2N9YJE7_9GAMM|nr:bifunctional UDP-N-acetylglucosamine diphosphorylase/glucosamine-1-phosphate N-acetyltransferase GlmU [Beggiatoa leptomitoformis]ALG69443.1 UDP-N-acetylglucosamine diphosphorylase/glucosamine-1-phosphate N-acetyltransferase [Beggiatoa leptomitoformis]AUI70642.1 UDP-N-acetylglucosamine diphosphorylase/glucosamine-1-phosphate N-acetyltransferase [Beggiatoa leptomitoformis]
MTINTSLAIVILAAGQGKRMYSDLPKVLHRLADKPLLQHVLDTAYQINPTQLYIVHGHGGAQLQTVFAQTNATWVQQAQQLGTGHAVAQVLPYLTDNQQILVLYGDVPLIPAETLKTLCAQTPSNQVGILTMTIDNPTGYGRIVRNDSGQVIQIIEEKEADSTTKAIHEINTGIMLIPVNALRTWLQQLTNHNAQGEYYLTDIIALAVRDGINITTHSPRHEYDVLGVNDRLQLATLERYYQQQQIITLMQQGLSVRDPARLDIRGQVSIGRDVCVDINVIFEGVIKLGNRVTIGANCILKDVEIADDVEIRSHCVLESCTVGANSIIGPFARLRPDTVLAEQVHIGNFVEVKKTTVGIGSKINHLSYIGDSEIGAGVNIGAGTITCNYDGVNKFKTIIEDGAFIGSDTQLVAPVTVGKGATIGAGSTIVHDTPAEKLTLSRAQQITIEQWQKPVKK